MSRITSFVRHLTVSDLDQIKNRSIEKKYKQGELVFSEGDQVDSFYIIVSGKVSIFFSQCGHDEEICRLGAGKYFGEMAIFNHYRRTASVRALEDAVLLSIDKDEFVSFVESHPKLAAKIKKMLVKRNEELVLRENLIHTTGIHGKKLHVSIKGDPSLRESAFFRGKHESIVDKILADLEPRLEDILLNRSIYKIFIGFNSGEIRTSSVFDPFSEEIHTADKLTDTSYIERHFPKIAYKEKAKMIQSIYRFIADDMHFPGLPEHWKNIFKKSRQNWQPVNQDDITAVMTKLTELRSIPDFYLRNFSISMIQDAIRMQFNCDGTHIVSSEDYQRFLEENLERIS
ncbi:MAG: cyclic nucleotide-binding domain-containing protein [Gammaproteobacteria bacterium]|nr:cyclic nucleotide-binding domain-containing protein [Gammaproteobacteria bacterium]